MPRLIGRDPSDPSLDRFAGTTVLDLAFNPAFPTRLRIENPDQYVPLMLRFIKTMLQ